MTIRSRASLALGLVLCAACAMARPVFEQSLSPDAPGLGEWLHLLHARYGCDSLLVLSRLRGTALQGRSQQWTAPEPGMEVCTGLAIGAWPVRVRAWPAPGGVREEWTFEGDTHDVGVSFPGGYYIVRLDGPDTRSLRVTLVSR